MEKIKVWLQYPWKFSRSSYSKSLKDYPPKGVSYINLESQNGVITNKKIFLFSNLIKKMARKFLSILNLSLPNSYKPKIQQKCDIMHFSLCLSKTNKISWVADIECDWQMYLGLKNKNSQNKVKKILADKNCKKILTWTKKTQEKLAKDFPEVKNKFEVLYPSVHLNMDKKKNKKRINLIFFGRYFFDKGGFHTLIAMDKLTKKYENVNATFISELPKGIKEKYSSNKKIKIYDLLPQEKVFELCKTADIFIYPGYSDSFGFGYLEAMSFGLPIITVNGFARNEIVEEGKTGFIIEKPDNFNLDELKNPNSKIINLLIKKTSTLIEDRKLISKMSQNCIEEIKNGKFSIKQRNKKLKRVYQEALK